MSYEKLKACPIPECTDGAIPHGPTPDGHWEAEQCQYCFERGLLLDVARAADDVCDSRTVKPVDERTTGAALAARQQEGLIRLQQALTALKEHCEEPK